jgi:hypothetical protein
VSIDIKLPDETQDVDIQAPAASKLPEAHSQRQVTRPWLRLRYQLSGLLVLSLLGGALIANSVLAGLYTADGAAHAYLAALQSGDAKTAWRMMQVSAPSSPAQATLTDQSALQAALAIGRPDIRSFTINSTRNLDAGDALVAFSYDTQSGTKQGNLAVVRSAEKQWAFYSIWHVLVTPTLLDLRLPKGSTSVTVDGATLSLPDGAKSTIAVLPVVHRLAFDGTPLIQAQTITVDAFQSQGQQVSYRPVLNQAGLDKAKAAVKSFFGFCAGKTELRPDNCPQSIGNFFVDSSRWQVVGDPTQDLALGFDQSLNLTGSGHFQMELSYSKAGLTGTGHAISAGGYEATFALSANALAVALIKASDSTPAASRPAGATDQAAKDLVAKAMAHCAQATSEFPADCPQELVAVEVTDVSWTLSGDPMSGAAVSFDPKSQVFTVQGDFRMRASYLVQGYSYSQDSLTNKYSGRLLWDGTSLQLITVDGSY